MKNQIAKKKYPSRCRKNMNVTCEKRYRKVFRTKKGNIEVFDLRTQPNWKHTTHFWADMTYFYVKKSLHFLPLSYEIRPKNVLIS